jgi:hypothetical protein
MVNRGGTKTRIGAISRDLDQHQWVKKNTELQNQFDA